MSNENLAAIANALGLDSNESTLLQIDIIIKQITSEIQNLAGRELMILIESLPLHLTPLKGNSYDPAIKQAISSVLSNDLKTILEQMELEAECQSPFFPDITLQEVRILIEA